MLDVAQESSIKLRRTWQPEKSSLVDETVDKLVLQFKTGAIKPELRPTTLVNLGGDFLALYNAAFHRLSRPQWAISRYPNGLSDLVSEINSKLQNADIKVIETKGEVSLYGRLTQDERNIIRTFQELYKSHEIEIPEAAASLREDFKLHLSESQINYFFPRNGERKTPAENGSFLERKRSLIHTIEELKSALGLDFSIKECLQGMVFESFLAAFLSDVHGPDKIQRQKSMPVVYHDLQGFPHTKVFLDFYLEDGTGSMVIESKLRNSFENIITSALPQLYAYEKESGRQQMLTVVYRRACPLMQMAYERDITLNEEATKMGLGELLLKPRSIRQVINYLSIEELIEGSPYRTFYSEKLPILDEILENAPAERLREYDDCLTRIAVNGENIVQKLEAFFQLSESCSLISPATANKEFGRLPGASPHLQGASNRVNIIIREVQRRQDKLLCELYESVFKERLENISETELAKLEALPKEIFNQAVLDFFAAYEEKRLRICKTRKDNGSYDEGKEVLQAFEEISSRANADFLKSFRLAAYTCIQDLTEIKNQIEPVHEHETKKGAEYEAFMKSIAKQPFSHLFRGGGEVYGKGIQFERFMQSNDTNNEQYKLIEPKILDICHNIHIKLNAAARTHDIRNLISVIDAANHRLSDLKEWVTKQRKFISGSYYESVLKSLREKTKKKTDPVGRRIYQAASITSGLEKNQVHDLYIKATFAYLKSLRLFTEYDFPEACKMIRYVCDNLRDHGNSALVYSSDRALSYISSTQVRSKYPVQNQELLLSTVKKQGTAFDRTDFLKRSLGFLNGSLLLENDKGERSHDEISGKAFNFLLEFPFETSPSIPPGQSKEAFITVKALMESLIYEVRCAQFEHLKIYWSQAVHYIPERFRFDKSVERPGIDFRLHFDALMEHLSEELFSMHLENGMLRDSLLVDFYLRKLKQASVIAYFAPELAIEFVYQNNPGRTHFEGSFEDYALEIVKLSGQNDEAFQGLVLNS